MFLYLFLFVGFIFLVVVFFWSLMVYGEGLYNKRETNSVFECGFSTIDSSRLPFSFRFFFFLILYMMFDVEFILMLALPYSIFFNLQGFLVFWFFFVFLFFSMMEEWRRGYLDWF